MKALGAEALYQRTTKTKTLCLIIMFFVLVALVLSSLLIGSVSLEWRRVLGSFLNLGSIEYAVVWQLRLPRIVMGVLVGSGLGLAGTIFQALLRNPLASPYTLGIASSAGFGAVTAIILGGSFGRDWLIPLNAFTCALVSVFVILLIAKLKNATAETVILAGIAVMFLFSALSSLLQYTGTMAQVHEIVFWFFGSLSKVGWREIAITALLVMIPLPLAFRWAWSFNLIACGDESARALGMDVKRVRMAGLLAASVVTAGSVCFTGVIGFIGLVAPHLARMIIGSNHLFLIPAAAMIGAIIVLAADTVARTVWSPHVIPLGIITSFLGVPFLFYLLLRKRKGYW